MEVDTFFSIGRDFAVVADDSEGEWEMMEERHAMFVLSNVIHQLQPTRIAREDEHPPKLNNLFIRQLDVVSE